MSGSLPRLSVVKNALVLPGRVRAEQPGGRAIQHLHGPVVSSDGIVVDPGFRGDAATIGWRIAGAVPAPGLRLRDRYLFAGLLRGNFGHFMFEDLVRHWALDVVRPAVSWGLYVAGDAVPGSDRAYGQRRIPGWTREMNALLAVKRLDAAFVPTLVEELVVPEAAGTFLGCFGPEHIQYAAIRRRLSKRLPPVEGPPRLYISKRRYAEKTGGTGSILHEALLEELLEKNGYVVIIPEELTLAQQLGLYRAARQIVCTDISPLHVAAMVHRPEQEIAIIYRRVREANHHAANVFAQAQALGFRGAHVEAVQQVVKMEAGPMGRPVEFAELDFAAVGKALAEHGFIAAQRWREPSEAERRTERARFDQRAAG